MYVLFANTGVQVLCVPLKGGARYNISQVGNGWQRCRCGQAAEVDPNAKKRRNEPESPAGMDFPYVQWQIIQGTTTKLYLAVDTTCGDPDIGYFCDANALTGDFNLVLEFLQDVNGQPLRGVPPVEICIRPAAATAGDAKHVHMVVDFGNSRTGALLLEVAGEISQTPQMLPFELTNRYHLDSWNDDGEAIRNPGARWFSSKTHWCNTPYLPPQQMKKIEFHQVDEGGEKKGWFGWSHGSKSSMNKVEVLRRPDMFEDLSMVRMGKEADDVLQVIATDDDIRTGVSSPKRYLWAEDASWLEGANWHMADPHDRAGTRTYCSTLHGALLKYIHEDDNDFLLKETGVKATDFAPETPLKPRHAPRSLMTAAIYEMLAQAYTYVNSIGYRTQSGDAGRAREIRTLTLTYPSGMIPEERERLQRQVQKAIEIFNLTLGRHQHVKPLLNLSIDEASAVHLTYIWSELRLLGQDPRIWFESLHQCRTKPKEEAKVEEPSPMMGSPAARRRMGAARGASSMKAEEEFGDKNMEVRIACIDIGGGTSDLMIAKYNFESKIDDYIRGKVMHQDGISLAGDQLAKRLLERIIVPAFADAVGMDEEDVILLFGPEVPRNREFRNHRVTWMNRLFIPLAQQYLTLATDGITTEPINHMDPELIDPAILESLQQAFDKLRGPGYYNLQQDMELYVHQAEFEGVVHEVFDELLFDFCRRCIDYNVDVVLLAGQPSKLGYIQKLVRMYLPLSPSRIVPMFHHYAGNWYPYQDEKGQSPGVIIDPKSPVVVGAAIGFMAEHGMLPQFKFEMSGKSEENTYYWGVMSDSTSGIRKERILFSPADESAREEITEFSTSSQRVIIGRKMSPVETAQATPIYVIKMDVGDRIGRTQVSVKIKRHKAEAGVEEGLEVESVSGIVAGQDAVLGENVFFTWRTLADERYYLDTGGLDNIELGGVV
ncbi:MAG: virulence factor SrfB [Planctomycetia bacterium]|nr:virulence factor SrfB [Planctomycetia bacterium]